MYDIMFSNTGRVAKKPKEKIRNAYGETTKTPPAAEVIICSFEEEDCGIDFDFYQFLSQDTAIYPNQGNNIVYPALGLVDEAGEVAGKVKKLMRDKGSTSVEDLTQTEVDELVKELGDTLWYLSTLATELGVSLAEVAENNLDKLASRKERNVLSGSGDNR